MAGLCRLEFEIVFFHHLSLDKDKEVIIYRNHEYYSMIAKMNSEGKTYNTTWCLPT